MVAETSPSPAPASPSDNSPAIAAPAGPSPPSRFAPILSALISGVGLAKIIAEHQLSAEDLHTLLNTPGIPDRLVAARALARLDDEFRTLAARARATDHLLHLIDTSQDTTEDRVESRRAATAVLKGPLAIPRPAPASVNPDRKAAGSPSRGGARLDISDWATPDDQDDAELDDDAAGADCASNRVSAPSPSHSAAPLPLPPPVDLPKPALDITPDALVAHQLAVIQSIDKPVLTPKDIVHAIDFHNLAFPNRYYAAKADAFALKLNDNPILNVPGAEVTAEPAVIDESASPRTATVRVTIKHPDRPAAACLFHLIHESTFFPKPDSPHAWHTLAITRDDSG